MIKTRWTALAMVGGMWMACWSGALALAQEVPNAPVTPPAAAQTSAPPRPQFFAGSVMELDATHIKVSRSLVGRPTESRSFAITATTKLNKTTVKVHSRVTVRFRHLPDGDVALEIQLRPVLPRTPKS